MFLNGHAPVEAKEALSKLPQIMQDFIEELESIKQGNIVVVDQFSRWNTRLYAFRNRELWHETSLEEPE
jgi:hypothetical protein